MFVTVTAAVTFLVTVGVSVGAIKTSIEVNADNVMVLREDMRELRAAHTRHLENHITGQTEDGK